MATRSEAANGPDEGGWVDFRLGFQPGFDGLRGFAIFSFMIYHGVVAYRGTVGSSVLPGAYLWLEFFFVQSGFLITSLLLEEWYRTGSVRLRRFYARRALRLLPALFVVVGFTAFWLLTYSGFKGNRYAWREVWASLFYVQNWFNALRPAPFPFYLNHVWSLSIEEQFYLIAPLLLLFALRKRVAPGRLFAISVALIVVSASWMGYLAHRAETAAALGRPYYGTDARAQGLLVGVALACAVHAGLWLHSKRFDGLVRVWGWLGVVVIAVLLFEADIKEKLAYQGLFLICSVAVAGVLGEIARHPDGTVSSVLGWRPLQMLGEMAYGLYLWHWPVMLVLRQYVHWSIRPQVVLDIVVTIAIATASYYLLERPILRKFSPRFARITPEREAKWSAARAVASPVAPGHDPAFATPQ